MATRTIATNINLTIPFTSPSVNLAAGVGYNCDLTLYMPLGTAMTMLIESSVDQVTWFEVSRMILEGAEGIGKGGQDMSRPVMAFSINGVRGTRFRLRVTDIMGTVGVTSLVIRNT